MLFFYPVGEKLYAVCSSLGSRSCQNPLSNCVTFDSPPVRCRMKAAPLGFREVEISVHAVVIVRSSPGGDSSSALSLPICWELEPGAAGGGDPKRDTPTENSINRWKYSNSLCFTCVFNTSGFNRAVVVLLRSRLLHIL